MRSELVRQLEKVNAQYAVAELLCDRRIAEGETEAEAEAESGEVRASNRRYKIEEEVLCSDDVAAIWAVLIRRHELGLCVLGDLAHAIGADLPGLI